MGSVVVTWGGACPVRARQLELHHHLERVACVSQPCFAEPSPILEFERAISGRVLVDARLFDAPPDSQHLVPLGNSPTSAAEIAIRLSGSRPPLPVPELYELVDASVFLRGIDFPLCNPLYPTENRISFVFATLNGCHELSDRGRRGS